MDRCVKRTYGRARNLGGRWKSASSASALARSWSQFENHVLQPVVYGKAVRLSPLAVLVAVLIGAELAGVIGALGAIPAAAAIQVVLNELLGRTEREPPATEAVAGAP